MKGGKEEINIKLDSNFIAFGGLKEFLKGTVFFSVHYIYY